MNYYSVVLRIIVVMCMEKYFFIGPRIIFRSVANLFWAYNALWASQLKWTGWSLWLPWVTILKTLKWRSAFKENATAKHCQGKKQKRFSSFVQNLSAAGSLCVHDEVFWTEDLIEETLKRLHDSYTILNLIEHDMSAQLNGSLPNLRGVARWGSWGARDVGRPSLEQTTYNIQVAKKPWQDLSRKSHCWKAHFFKICFFVKYFCQRLLSLVNMGLHAAIIQLSPLIHEREQRYKP